MNNLNIREKTVHVTRGDMDCIQFGSGEKKLVILIGMNMTGLAGLAEPVAQAYSIFAEEYTVYVLDYLKLLPEGYSVRDMAGDAAEAMDALGIENADVMGNSLGGMAAQYLAADYPEKVNSLVLCSCMCRMSELGNRILRHWAELARKNDGRGIYRDFFERVYQKPDMELLALIENTATDEQCLRFAIMADACLEFNSCDELKRIKCPAFVVGAEHDRVLGGESPVELAEKLGCKLYMYPESKFGHNVCDEAPDFKQRMMDFFHSLN